MDSQWLLYLGMGMMAIAAAGAVAGAVMFYITGRRLKHRLTEEFGEKRH